MCGFGLLCIHTRHGLVFIVWSVGRGGRGRTQETIALLKSAHLTGSLWAAWFAVLCFVPQKEPGLGSGGGVGVGINDAPCRRKCFSIPKALRIGSVSSSGTDKLLQNCDRKTKGSCWLCEV